MFWISHPMLSQSRENLRRRDFFRLSSFPFLSIWLNDFSKANAHASVNRFQKDSLNVGVSPFKAFAFDVIGTVVDWRTTVINELTQFGKSRGLSVDWPKFLNSWRIRYGVATQRVRRGEIPWMNSDTLRKMALDPLLSEFKISGLNEEAKDHLNRVWRRLRPWPDSVTGLGRLRKQYIIAALSDGSMASLVSMAKSATLPWDCILSSELVKHYKPDKEVYLMAAELLGFKPEEIMMVSAHKYDLLGAKAIGMKTTFVTRPLELGSAQAIDQTPDSSLDLIARDLNDLADKLGV